MSYEAYTAVADRGQDWPSIVKSGASSQESTAVLDENMKLTVSPDFQERTALPTEGIKRAQSGSELRASESTSSRTSSQAERFHIDAVSLTSPGSDAAEVTTGLNPEVFSPAPQNLGVQNSERAVHMPNEEQSEKGQHQMTRYGRAGRSVAAMSGSSKSGTVHPKTPHRHILPTDHASQGHNLQSVEHHEILSDMLAALDEECETWLVNTGQISDQETANQAGHFAERFASLEKEAEEARTLEKRPALEWGRAIDGKWKPIVTSAAEGKKRMKRAVEPFLIAERLRIEEEARTQGLLASAPVAPKAGLYGRKVGLRASYVMQITDEAALIEAFRNDPRLWRDPEVRLALKRLAEADLRAGREVSGAELVQELTAA